MRRNHWWFCKSWKKVESSEICVDLCQQCLSCESCASRRLPWVVSTKIFHVTTFLHALLAKGAVHGTKTYWYPVLPESSSRRETDCKQMNTGATVMSNDGHYKAEWSRRFRVTEADILEGTISLLQLFSLHWTALVAMKQTIKQPTNPPSKSLWGKHT